MGDDLHPCPFSDITMLLRKQGRGVPHPGPTIMLKLYFPHHRLTFCTVWDLFRGNHLTFDRDGGRRGGIGYFFYVYPADWSWREKILERKYLAKKIPEKCFMAYNSGKKSYPCCMSRKKIYHLPEVRGTKSYPSQITHTHSQVKWSAPYNTCDGVHVAKIFSICEHLKTWRKRF